MEIVSWIEHDALEKIQADPGVLDAVDDLSDAQKAMLRLGGRPPRLHMAQCRSIERKYGQPIEQVLRGFIEKHQGKPHPIADELGVHVKTVQRWRREMGIAKRHLRRT